MGVEGFSIQSAQAPTNLRTGNLMVKDTNFIAIQGWMVNDLKLKGNKLFIFAIVHGFTQGLEGQTYNGSLSYLADWTNSTKQGVIKALKELERDGLIVGIRDKENSTKTVRYYTTKFNSNYTTKFNSTIKQSLTNNIEDNIDNNKKSVFSKNDLTPRKEDTVPIRHFGESFTKFRDNLPEEFKDVMRKVWGSDQIGGMTALENFYNYNAMKGGRFTEWYWVKIFKTYMYNEK